MKIVYNENSKIIDNPSIEDYLSVLSMMLNQRPITIRLGEFTVSIGPEDIQTLNKLLGVATAKFESKVQNCEKEMKSQTKRFAPLKPKE